MNAHRPGSETATRVWLLLIGLTLLTFLFGIHGRGGPVIACVVLVIALFKAQMVVDHFMGLRDEAPLWRMLLSAYLLTIGLLIALAFVIAAW